MTEEEYKNEYTKIRPTIDKCWELQLNKDLVGEYCNSLEIRPFLPDVEQKLSCPLFIHLGPHYNAGEGVFIIGQETHEWGSKATGKNLSTFKNFIKKEERLMEAQSEWLLMHYQYSINSDFLNAVKAITGIAKGEDFLNSQFVWDNLIAMDYDKGSYRNLKAADRKKVLEYSSDKLKLELKIAKPRIAIFLIGSYGDSEFWDMDVFEGLKDTDLKPVIDNLKTFSLTLSQENHTIECYTTYHPSYKGWKNKEDVMRKLAEIVKDNHPKQ